MAKPNEVWDWERGKRVHAVFCKGLDGDSEGCTIPLGEHPFPEWWVYVGYFIETGDNNNIFVRFREEKNGKFTR